MHFFDINRFFIEVQVKQNINLHKTMKPSNLLNICSVFWSKRQVRTCGNHAKEHQAKLRRIQISNQCTQCTLPTICTQLKSNPDSRHNIQQNHNMNETVMAGQDVTTWSSEFRKHFLPVYDNTSPGRGSARPGRGSAEWLRPGPLVHSCPSIPKLEFRF